MFNPGKAKHPWKDLRSICLTIDSFIYFILSLVFKIFFNIVNSNFIDNDIINQFYSNIQLLLGVFITFKLCFSLINYIINPDRVSDNKVGAGKLIMRVVVALCMLTLLVPLSNIPDYDAPSGSYNEAIKSKGILFGTLQIVQEKVLSQNVIGALILGVRNQNNVNSNYEVQADSIVAGILKGFIQIAKDDNGQQYCNIKEYDNYNKTSYYGTVLLYAEEKTCEYNNDDYYAFSYIFLGSWICGALFIIVVAGFCVDVAIRMIKLTVLRLIAPIPIISYISPESGKNGAFNSWVKMLTKTYLDLFLRIAIIYFVVYISSTLLAEDTIIFSSDNGTLNTFSRIFIWLGLFMFAKQAPKFFMDMLGMKGDGKGFFSGLNAITGFGALAGGTIGSVVNDASYNYRHARDNGHGRIRSLLSGARGIASGGIFGAATGFTAAVGANDHYAEAIRRAQYRRNTNVRNGAGFFARTGDNISSMFTGSTYADRDSRNLEILQNQLKDKQEELRPIQERFQANQNAMSEIAKHKEMIQTEALKSDIAYGTYNGENFNYAKLVAAMNASNGTTFQYGTNTYNKVDFSEPVLNAIKDSQSVMYETNWRNGIYSNAKLDGNDVRVKQYTANVGISYDGSFSGAGAAIGDAVNNMNACNPDIMRLNSEISNINSNIASVQNSDRYRRRQRISEANNNSRRN